MIHLDSYLRHVSKKFGGSLCCQNPAMSNQPSRLLFYLQLKINYRLYQHLFHLYHELQTKLGSKQSHSLMVCINKNFEDLANRIFQEYQQNLYSNRMELFEL